MNVNLLKPFGRGYAIVIFWWTCVFVVPAAIGTLEHDRIAIDQYVERTNQRLREASGSQIIWNDGITRMNVAPWHASALFVVNSIRSKFLMVSGHEGSSYLPVMPHTGCNDPFD